MGARRYASGEAVCEETVVLTRLDKDVPIGAIDVPSGSTLSGKTSVSLLDCSPVVTNGSLSLLISLYVQEELYLTTPQGASFPLAFGFRLQELAPLANCGHLAPLEDNLDCHIISLAGTDHLTLHDDGTFDQLLEIRIQVKLVADHKLP
ncbi:MAG: hypothetical protein ACOX20_12470 [Limnochordia bacterium]|jgi:hypothetical protein|nr:hypothetical protein [Bacillota bacterium]